MRAVLSYQLPIRQSQCLRSLASDDFFGAISEKLRTQLVAFARTLSFKCDSFQNQLSGLDEIYSSISLFSTGWMTVAMQVLATVGLYMPQAGGGEMRQLRGT